MKIVKTEQLVLARYDKNGHLEPLPENEAKWLKVFANHWEHHDKQGQWLFVSRDDVPVGPEEKEPDAVIIVAIHVGDDNNRLVLTSEFRVPIMGREIGFPAGLKDKGESAVDAAIREFFEETGLSLKVTGISSSKLYSSAGCTNESVQIIFGMATGKISSTGLEVSEDIKVILADYQYISDLCELHNVPIGAKAWSILYMLKNMWSEKRKVGGFGHGLNVRW